MRGVAPRAGALLAVATGLTLAVTVSTLPTGAQLPPLPTLPIGPTTTFAGALPTTTTTTTTPPDPGTTDTTVSDPSTDVFVPDPFPFPLPSDPGAPAPGTTPPAQPEAPPASGAGRSTPPVPLDALRAAAVTGSFGIGMAAVLVAVLVLIGSFAFVRPGGLAMRDTRRVRLLVGLGCIAAAAIVGIVGYLEISLEPDVNRQIPYLASAGMAIVVLATVGGALVVAEQLRADERRLEELEDAVRALATTMAGVVEAPPRRAVERTTRKRT